LTPADVLSAATARAGEHLGLSPLGQLVEGAPADLIAVRGNAVKRFKLLEYPDLVVAGGAIVVEPDRVS
jgi:imidazolonepropionase-like amidohydrolase